MNNRQQTLCWDCAKATGGCSWADHWEHSPVPGWKAIETRLKWNYEANDCSFIVIECPDFERDATGGGAYRIKKIDKNGNEI